MFRFLALILLLAGSLEAAPAPTAPPAAADVATLKTDAEALWGQRGDKEKLKEALAKYEQIAAAEPQNREVLTRLLRGWYFLGDGHETEKAAKLEVWAKALKWGDKCIGLNAQYTALLTKGDETPETAARAFTKEDSGCVYWYASALGKWAKLSGLPTTLKNLPTVKGFMNRLSAADMDNTYYYDGPNRYWGAYYAAIPSFAGQDLNKSKEYFDKAIASNPNFLGTHVLLAENWAVKTQNKEVFTKELNWVLAQDPGVIPEIRPEAEAEQRKAKRLLDSMNDLFAN